MEILEMKVNADNSMEVTVETESGEEKVIHLNREQVKVLFTNVKRKYYPEENL